MGRRPAGRPNCSLITCGSNAQTQQVPSPCSVAAIIIWSTTIEVSISLEFIWSYLRTQARSVSAQAMMIAGAPKMLPLRSKRGQARAARARSSLLVHTLIRVGCLLQAEGQFVRLRLRARARHLQQGGLRSDGGKRARVRSSKDMAIPFKKRRHDSSFNCSAIGVV